MEQIEIVNTFEQLRKALLAVTEKEEWPGYVCGLTAEEFEQFTRLINKEFTYNPWFTKSNCMRALRGIATMLEPQKLQDFARQYTFSKSPKTVAIIMAGNIPFVGFHDLLCVLITGNRALCKLSSSDQRIPMQIIQWLLQWNPALADYLTISLSPIKSYDAVIATGSNNSIAQFETYFGHVPHLFRKNRTSVAVLNGTETDEELSLLGSDCFTYFGMGCRNVSKLFVPKDFDLNRIFQNFLNQSDIIQHHKYGNNYDYNRTVYLMNQIPFLDNNVFLLKEDAGLHAPLSVLFYEYYQDKKEVVIKLESLTDELQAVVGHGYIPFGQAQTPEITDYADGVDTCAWLNSLD